MTQEKPKLFIGTIIFGALTRPYLSFFLESLKNQTYQNFKLLIHDNTEDNLGFSKAYNTLIHQALTSGADYFFVINPDVVLESNALEKLIKALEHDDRLASVMPKLRRWDFANKTFTKIIDSCGLGLVPCLNFFDYGQGEEDKEQYDQGQIIGSSGAAALFRLKDLVHVAENGQFFDEHFFMYKEDCDLAYRLALAGFKSKLVPEAIGYHDRTSAAGSFIIRFFNRFKRSHQVNRWAFVNQHFLFIKYWHRQTIGEKFLALIRMKIMFLEALIFEQYLLPCYKTIWHGVKSLKRY